jgi:hypothetical protein
MQSAQHTSEIAQSTQQSQEPFRGKVKARIVAHTRRILSRKGKEKAQEPSLIIAIKVDGMESSHFATGLGKAKRKAKRSTHTPHTPHGSQSTSSFQQSIERSQQS